MHATCMRAYVYVRMCGYKLRFVRVAFSISHTPGGHLPPEAKSRFGRAWLSIMYNRDTSAPSAPLFAVYLSGVSARGMPSFMSTRTRYVVFRLPDTDTPIVFYCARRSLSCHSCRHCRWTEMVARHLPAKTWSRRVLNSPLFNAKAFRFPLLPLNSIRFIF